MIELEPAYLLHSRPYRETSVIADYMTERQGRLSVIVRGARGKKSAYRSYLQPFCPVYISYLGRSNLKTLSAIEARGVPVNLTGRSLYSAMYLNEILVRLVKEGESFDQLFDLYETTIRLLEEGSDIEVTLRQFELKLMADIGYGINFQFDSDQRLIESNKHYAYVGGRGFVQAGEGFSRGSITYTGSTLKAIGSKDLSDDQVKYSAKVLCRTVLQPLLGAKPLQSRALFASLIKEK